MYEIRPPRNEAELQAGIDLIRSVFLQSFGTYPHEDPLNLLIAEDEDSRVVGTISLQTRNEDGEFGVERFFYCPPDLDLTKACELRRLTSLVPHLGVLLCAAAVLTADRMRLERIVFFCRREIAVLLKRASKLAFEELRLPLRKENIPQEEYPYYLNEKSPVVVLTNTVSSLLPRATELLAETNGDVKFSFS